MTKKICLAALSVITVLSSGCATLTNGKASGEFLPTQSLSGVEIKTKSLMQQMMDAGQKQNMDMRFAPETSDRTLSEYSDGNLFSIIVNSSALNGDIITARNIGPNGTKTMKIKKGPPSIDKLRETADIFSAEGLLKDSVRIGTTRLSVQDEISQKVRAIAIKYDELRASFGGGDKGVYDFCKFLSATFVVEKSALFFGYDKKSNVLFLSDRAMQLESSPTRILSFKKQLTDEGITFHQTDGSGIVIDSGFEDWAKAFTLKENLDPFGSQTYLISAYGGIFTVQEGYKKSAQISIEFIGWNRDGSREYAFYGPKGMRKITSTSREAKFVDGEEYFEIKFY
jgi:hypothetical protein